MSDRHPLPSGNWIELRDWRDLRRGDKKRAVSRVSDTERAAAAGYEVADGLLIALVTSWSYELPLPSQAPESLDLLPMEDDGPIMELLQPAMRALFPAAANAADKAQVADESSPTGPSAG